MPQIINTNFASLNAQKNLNTTQSSLQTSLARLSSGLRINSAKDDAAGLAISDRMSSQINGLNQAVRNANDGISLAQTADGALSEVTNILQRMRELSVQSANSTNSAADRKSLQSEVNQLSQEMSGIAAQTSFNGLNLLDGTFTSQQFQVGANANQTIGVSIGAATTKLTGSNQVFDTNAAGIEAATSGQSGKLDGVVMQTAALGATLPAANKIATQTLTLTDADGVTQTLNVANPSLTNPTGPSAKDIAAGLNGLTGATATASTSANLKLTAANIQDGERASFDINVDGTQKHVSFIRDSSVGTIDAQMNTALTAAFAGNADVSFATNAASGGIDMTSASGANFAVSNFDVQQKSDVKLDTFTGFAKDTGLKVTVAGTDLTDAGTGWNSNVTLASTNGAPAVTHQIGVTAGVAEVFTATFGVTVAAGTMSFDGTGALALGAGQTAIQNATQYVGEYNAVGGRTWQAVNNGDGTATFTKRTTGAVTDVVSGDFTAGGGAAAVTAAAPTTQGSGSTIKVDGVDSGVAATVGNLATKIAGAFSAADFNSLGISATTDITGGAVTFKALGSSGAAGISFTSQATAGGSDTIGAAGRVTLTAADATVGTYASTNTDSGTAASTLQNTTANAFTAKATNVVAFGLTDGTNTDAISVNLTGVDLSTNAKVAAQLNTALQNMTSVDVVNYTAGDSSIELRTKQFDKTLTISSGATTAADAANTAADLTVKDGNTDTSIGGGPTIDLSIGASILARDSETVNSTFATIGLKGATGSAQNIKEVAAADATIAGVATGQVSISLKPNYTIASSLDGSLATGTGGVFDSSLSGSATASAKAPNLSSNQGLLDTSGGNNVSAQTLSIQGQNFATVSIAAKSSASEIAAKVNEKTDSTGVKATARTTVNLNTLSADGTVSFSLFGSNDAATPVTISAAVTKTDLSALVSSINQNASKTGITASLDAGGSSLTMISATGDDIGIKDFRHSAAVTDTTGGGTQVVESLNVTGGANSAAVTLQNGGTAAVASQTDSTITGGQVELDSSQAFTISSSASAANGSLFAGKANVQHGSGLAEVQNIDISTISGANSAINVIDGALAQVNAVRGDLGAIQNRFESTVSNLTATSNNVSAARSRVQDTDFATETANLSRSQILQQAGVAMLAQANQLPQLVLSLLK